MNKDEIKVFCDLFFNSTPEEIKTLMKFFGMEEKTNEENKKENDIRR